MRNPPLCEYWQLAETGPGTYSIEWLMDAHEAMGMEEEMLRRAREAAEK
jgi:hypothetical protein